MGTQRSSQTFCARPGCGLAKSGHGFMPDACSNFIQPGSKEAHEAKRVHLSVVETPAPGYCVGCVTAASGDFGTPCTCDEVETPAPDTTLPIDGNVLDRVLLAGAIQHQNEAIATAKRHLVTGLRSQRAGMPKFAMLCFEAALDALGDLGSS